MTKKVLTAFIFARGGSKGVKNKNIRDVAGKPLIAHTINSAFQSTYINRVIVSTDSKDIAEVSLEYGAEVLMRPSDLAKDDTPEIMAWRHAIKENIDTFEAQNIFISLPATSPLRLPKDIDRAVDKFNETDCDILFAIKKSSASPYLSMVQIDNNDLLQVLMKGAAAYRRQDVPDVYDITGSVYVTTPSYINTCERLDSGRVGYIEIPKARCVDIDEEFDMYMADLLLRYPYKEA